MHVAELWRFPVKSMAGEPLARADVRPDGIVGDRVAYVLGAHGRIMRRRAAARKPVRDPDPREEQQERGVHIEADARHRSELPGPFPLGHPRSITVDVHDSAGKGPRSFLRQIVSDATLDDPVFIFPRERIREMLAYVAEDDAPITLPK